MPATTECRRYARRRLDARIGDSSHIASAEVSPTKTESAVVFLRPALEFYAGYGVRGKRAVTDNGSPRSLTHPRRCLPGLALKHLVTRPYCPNLTAGLRVGQASFASRRLPASSTAGHRVRKKQILKSLDHGVRLVEGSRDVPPS